VPLVQLGVRVDDLRFITSRSLKSLTTAAMLKMPPQTFIKSWLTHDSVILTEPRPDPRPGPAQAGPSQAGRYCSCRAGAPPVSFSKALAAPDACFATLPTPSAVLPARCRIVPGKLAVKGLRGAKRWDATTGSALDWGLSRRQDRPARGGWPGCSGRRSQPGASRRGPADGGCGGTALRRRDSRQPSPPRRDTRLSSAALR